MIPKNLPERWRCLGYVQAPPDLIGDTHAFIRTDGMRALFSVEIHPDGKWVHLSVSHENKLPSWGELVSAKRDFFGPEITAVQILPDDSQYVNLHNHTLHLWHYLDGPCWPIVEGR